ncbi:hypothetical protein [Echinicola rosea]|uniref:Beta-galactosidase n=1 Tax=Echinicola rosea TaxID=1807691 RepID=A0ABQ1UQQ0_9BACT|nr:hypothetical protein [Echinicola rosea]GGF24908.1 hypothetical protein GCM10011339_11290 [Echinicola rosea]
MFFGILALKLNIETISHIKHERLPQTVFLSFILFFFALGDGVSQETFIANTQNRSFTSMNGKWKYVLDPYETGQMGGMPVFKNAIAHKKEDRVVADLHYLILRCSAI